VQPRHLFQREINVLCREGGNSSCKIVQAIVHRSECGLVEAAIDRDGPGRVGCLVHRQCTLNQVTHRLNG
jgi:hypothetical protein